MLWKAFELQRLGGLTLCQRLWGDVQEWVTFQSFSDHSDYLPGLENTTSTLSTPPPPAPSLFLFQYFYLTHVLPKSLGG